MLNEDLDSSEKSNKKEHPLYNKDNNKNMIFKWLKYISHATSLVEYYFFQAVLTFYMWF